MRRSFRIGLRLGLLVGIVAAALKMAQSRRSRQEEWSPPPPPSWPPVQEPSVTPEPPVSAASEAGSVVTRSAPTEAVGPLPEPLVEPADPEPEPLATAPLWVEPEGGVCPSSHPVKAKLASGLFHLPGMFAYDRTRPDRCYADEASASEDGLTRAKR